jgi:hypothetical protein
MHYFSSASEVFQTLKAAMKSLLVFGDLTIHEKDDNRFLEKLEKTVSEAHNRYFKPSETRTFLENNGFHVARMKTVSYRKSYLSLMEDKGEYFHVSAEQLTMCIRAADAQAKSQYGLTDTELTLYYTVVVATNN